LWYFRPQDLNDITVTALNFLLSCIIQLFGICSQENDL
jgi:hypothetical protein